MEDYLQDVKDAKNLKEEHCLYCFGEDLENFHWEHDLEYDSCVMDLANKDLLVSWLMSLISFCCEAFCPIFSFELVRESFVQFPMFIRNKYFLIGFLVVYNVFFKVIKILCISLCGLNRIL